MADKTDVVKYLLESGQVDGDVVEYVEHLEGVVNNLEDIINQLDQKISEASEALK